MWRRLSVSPGMQNLIVILIACILSQELIHEKFGDGIMSAIDYSMHVEKEENPAGDRVVITLHGKFLRYSSW